MPDTATIVTLIQIGVETVAAVRTDVGWLKQGMKELKEQ
ncbi:hypothetical protein N482_10770 [Pseudoalteromonas luteoviolacea NCIMB 1942]|uniref:Uncharacterized protein n=1 Tax=Pseudoalteromonas luteoviolacea NCIMB 1942 TaxID=1365253 RepID=A0A167BZF3_9GAMM|nr:hypothetical protein N482_10770 [Pseudoalteromonas luteoviolacea NCIMB 1942]